MFLTLKTASIRDVEEINGIKILVTRTYPKWIPTNGIFNHWFKELSPSYELLNHFQTYHDISYYRETFIKQMNCQQSQDKLHFIGELSKEKDVTLFCYEPDGQFCHRYILQELVLMRNIVGYKICPFYCTSDRRCAGKKPSLSIIKTHTKSGSLGQTIFKRTIGHPEKCDFYGELNGNMLSKCVIFVEKTKLFKCKTCAFNFVDYVCLTGNQLKSNCNSWISKDFDLGNVKHLSTLQDNPSWLDELKEKSLNSKNIE